MHTGGEPLRVLTSGLPEIKGSNILEKRRYFKEHFDAIRKGIMWEPRGHADMYGAIITVPISNDADFGTFFIHNEGYSTMCGHAIIALTKMAFETGLTSKNPGETLVIDAPPGKIRSDALAKGERILGGSFRNVLYHDKEVEVAGFGTVRFDAAFGGAFYAVVDAERIGLELDISNYSLLIDLGRRIKLAVMKEFEIAHPFEEDLSFLYGTIFTGRPVNPANHSRNVCIFADGELDRSSTGSGVSARAALHFARGEFEMNREYTIESIIGSEMNVSVEEETTFGAHSAVIPRVSGTASFTGKNEFWFDPEDSLGGGFLIR
jgi:trans-L-3-hydroxyproline dehydratase